MRLPALLLLLVLPAAATPITSQIETLKLGEELRVDFGIWNYFKRFGVAPDRLRVRITGPAGQSRSNLNARTPSLDERSPVLDADPARHNVERGILRTHLGRGW
jgi:hypothetical protein